MFYTKRFCIECVNKNIKEFPQEIQQVLSINTVYRVIHKLTISTIRSWNSLNIERKNDELSNTTSSVCHKFYDLLRLRGIPGLQCSVGGAAHAIR